MDCRNHLYCLVCVLSLMAAGCKPDSDAASPKPDAGSKHPRPSAPDAGEESSDAATAPSDAATAPSVADAMASDTGPTRNPTNPTNPPDAGRTIEPKPDTGVKQATDPDPGRDPDADAGAESMPAAERCRRGGYCAELALSVARSADLLFVVDNSNSMALKQAALRDQFPKLIQTLTQGETSAGVSFPPLRDLHLGVVSTDMGIVGVASNFPGCNSPRHINGGDDGLLQHPGGTGAGCAASYPAFLSFDADRDAPSKLAQDFGCIASLGTAGCGFEQPLEAALKALWPKTYVDAAGNAYAPDKNPILFLSTTNDGRYGHGDVPVAQGGNGGFSRNQRGSLLAIVLVTDEEDCSSRSTSHLISTNDPNNPVSTQPVNLRCYYNKQNLFDVTRYIKGYPGLRPGREREVLFAAIVGVPADLVSANARANVDFSQQGARDAYYDHILSDNRMTEVPTQEDIPALANLTPSCVRTDAAGVVAKAYPPRRIVEVAKGIGENALIQSICDDDLGSAMDGIVDHVRARGRPDCLPRPLTRTSSGNINCDVLWELPPETASTTAPVRCTDRAFLRDANPPNVTRTPDGGRVCEVAQLPVLAGQQPSGAGFYYDDFSAERRDLCDGGSGARIAFTDSAQPPPDVRVVLDCGR